MSVSVLLPLPLGGMGPEYPCLCICRNLGSRELAVRLTVPRSGRVSDSFVVSALPPIARPLPFKWIRGYASRCVETAFRSQLKSGEVAFLWSEISLETAHGLKDMGVMVVREKTNCHKATGRRICDEAYERIGVAPPHGISDQLIRKEVEELGLADAVFSASPMVTMSLIENGVPQAKIIETSYGWEPHRLHGTENHLPKIDGITVLFVGSICVRKGVHLLLEAWAKARVRGRLVLAGSIEPALREKFADLLNRDDVVHVGFVKDMGPLYRSADIFAFPSLEEGGPLVTYEAMANGLPTLVSPMGAGRALRSGEEGLVVEPYNIEGWTDGLRRLAGSEELRVRLGQAGRLRAQRFTWAQVGEDRRQSLLSRFAQPSPPEVEVCDFAANECGYAPAVYMTGQHGA